MASCASPRSSQRAWRAAVSLQYTPAQYNGNGDKVPNPALPREPMAHATAWHYCSILGNLTTYGMKQQAQAASEGFVAQK